jgi:ankyrin repeat protein
VNKPNPDGVTPLINALDNKRWDIAMLLLDKGANPHTWDMSGRTPIYVAVDVKTFTGAGQFGGAGNNQARGVFGAEEAEKQAAATKAIGPMDVINRLLAMNVDVNHQLTRKRPYGANRGRFADYDCSSRRCARITSRSRPCWLTVPRWTCRTCSR